MDFLRLNFSNNLIISDRAIFLRLANIFDLTAEDAKVQRNRRE